MKNDFLSDALRRNDPAEEQPETESAEARKAALLARCAAEPFTDPTLSRLATQQNTPRETRWAVPALAGAGALTAAALYGAAAWFGANKPASQTVPAQMVQVSPRPSATPAPRRMATVPAAKPHAVSERNVAERTVERKSLPKRRDKSVAVSMPTGSPMEPAISVKPLRQESALSPVKPIVRASRKRETEGPRLIADTTKSQAAPVLPKIVEPVVERVIIEQDATPAEAAPTVTTVAITMQGGSESVVVSRAAEPATN